MSNKFEPLNQNDVINLNNENDGFLIKYHTFKVKDFIYKLIYNFCDEEKSIKWLKGVDSEVLTSTTGWCKGKIRLTIEFCPDEPEEIKPESLLDDIRQTIAQNSS